MELENWKTFPLDAFDREKHEIAVARRLHYHDLRNQTLRHPWTGTPISGRVGVLTFRRVVHASMGPRHGQQFMQLLRCLGTTTCLELGTCGGISSMFLYAACLSNARRARDKALYIGIEGCEARAHLTIESLQQVHDPAYGEFSVHRGTFEQELTRALRRFGPRLRFAYLDGHHLGNPTKTYFGTIAAVMQRGVIAIDDIHYNHGMSKATSELQRHPRVVKTMTLDNSKRFYVLRDKNDASGTAS
jgi:predicted O-methyltransferase YrrM